MKIPSIKQWPVWTPTGRGRIVAAVVAVLLLAGSATQITVAAATGLPDGAVLRAYDTVVTQERFQQRITLLNALYGVKPPTDGERHDEFNRTAAKSIAVSLILHHAAREHGIVISDKQAHDTLGRLIDEQMPAGRDGFIRFLGNKGISENDVLAEIKRQMESSRLFQNITQDVPVATDAEARQAYHDRKQRMVSPEQRRLRNIVVKTKPQAEAVLRQAHAGADFTRLARSVSLDASSRSKGGNLGKLTREQLDPAYAKEAFAAAENTLFGPVRTKYGWNVGQVVAIKPPEQLPYAQVKNQLKAELTSKHQLQAWRGWLTKQIAAADVDYADAYLPANPTAPPSHTPR